MISLKSNPVKNRKAILHIILKLINLIINVESILIIFLILKKLRKFVDIILNISLNFAIIK